MQPTKHNKTDFNHVVASIFKTSNKEKSGQIVKLPVLASLWKMYPQIAHSNHAYSSSGIAG